MGTPSENALRIENSELEARYEVLSHQLDEALGVLEDLQQRDDNLYRVILQTDPISPYIRKSGNGNINRYEHLEDMANADMIIENSQKIDYLKRQLYIQSKSYDEIIALCKQNDERLQCIPAIQPVANKDLKYTASGYGRRIDPIYKTVKFHHGMDFSANTGTPVYATGNGTVTMANRQSGYGLTIEIDHGFDYKTLYAHLSKILVKRGQKVKRGEIIGLVGSTGKSTGPHLHYEVVNKGRKVNPVNYYFMDLTEEEYDQMIQIAANHGKVYD
jgi:murein DD-endopeptidase MepM/ murein hydrolase activator NlpD